jgi:hypothetical protein
MSESRVPSGRLQLILLALLFAAPPLLALLFYFVPALQPEARTNYGELVQPVIPLPEIQWRDAAGNPVDRQRLLGRWTLLYPAEIDCELRCEQDLYNLRQLRLLLNDKRSRVQRVLAVVEPGDLGGLAERLQPAHADLKVVAVPAQDQPLFHAQPAGTVWVIDPLGNVMMRYPPDPDLRRMLRDIKRLLRLSQIG